MADSFQRFVFGARRNSVSPAAKTLQQTTSIHYSRGCRSRIKRVILLARDSVSRAFDVPQARNFSRNRPEMTNLNHQYAIRRVFISLVLDAGSCPWPLRGISAKARHPV
jgi:hypothetical protein